MNKKLIVILRWIGVLPVSVAAFLLSNVIFNLVKSFYVHMYVDSEGGDGGWVTKYIFPVINDGMSSYLFVYFGTMIAPKFKANVALVLMIIMCILAGGFIFLLIQSKEYITLINIISIILGAITSYFLMKEENEYEIY